MRLKDAVPKPGSRTRSRRLGRGISAGQGASCGKGMRGQKSRSGRGTRPGFEGGQNPLYRRLPKLKGFPLVRQKRYTTINVGRLVSLPANAEVTLFSLMKAGIVTTDDGPLKLLGDGELNIALNVKAAAFTKTARHKIEAAGGTCEVIGSRTQPSEEAVPQGLGQEAAELGVAAQQSPSSEEE
ncbi:MAG: 50S ribosomal protein L15 [Oscillatoriales cyanobacterium RM2_1_1]|nr:50S ribosomal protein L15 [Oscillatoriales cyanobacterium SM2_3_0]NJO44349.1 50S ribosomal protein L15 [Oscillatoriales cyanobacterium RM2_1_1]